MQFAPGTLLGPYKIECGGPALGGYRKVLSTKSNVQSADSLAGRS